MLRSDAPKLIPKFPCGMGKIIYSTIPVKIMAHAVSIPGAEELVLIEKFIAGMR
jgi:hypothetical protein